MHIKLNERYQIRGISMNFVLEEKFVNQRKGKNQGKEYWKVVGYYPNLQFLLNGLFKRQLQETETEGVSNIINEVKTSVNRIMEQIEVLQEER